MKQLNKSAGKTEKKKNSQKNYCAIFTEINQL